MIVATAGVQSLGESFISEVTQVLREFKEFAEENDPYGEHDFGAFKVRDLTLFFKIDYFDLTLSSHSPDAADPNLTKRVLTIMLAEEY